MRDRSELLAAQRIALVGYLLDQLEQSPPLPANPAAPDEVSLILVAHAAGFAPEVMINRAHRNLVERWSDTLGVWPDPKL